MKPRRTPGLILLLIAIFSCDHDDLSIPPIQGLSLYWHHDVFGDEGRGLQFEATTTNTFDNNYDLVFNTTVVNKTIIVRLTNSIDKGKCPYFPGLVAGDPTKCNASGEFYISDKQLDPGVYTLKVITPSFEVTSTLTVTTEKVTWIIPTNPFVACSIEHVYPIPPNLLYGTIVYQGSTNTNDAKNFLAYLTSLGLSQTTVPNYPYRYLTVDENGQPPVSDWEPDYHSIGLLFKMNNIDFKTIVEKSKEYFNQRNLNIYLYTSYGDQAFLSKTEGITVVYSKP